MTVPYTARPGRQSSRDVDEANAFQAAFRAGKLTAPASDAVTDTRDEYGQITPQAAVAHLLPQVTISAEQPYGSLSTDEQTLDAVRRLVAFASDPATKRALVVYDLVQQGWSSVAEDVAEGLSTDQILRRLRGIGEDEDSDIYLTIAAADLPEGA